MRLRCAAANALWLAASWRADAAFRANLHRVGAVQESLLGTILRNSRLAVRTLDEYREAVPIRGWDALGEIDQELAEPVERYELTSGSSGPVKRIPYTRSLRRQFAAAIAPWIVDLFRSEPRAFAGEAYWSISPGAESDEEILSPLTRRLVRAVQAVPSTVRLATEVEAFRRETMAHLVRCRTLSLISVWHPSFLELLIGDEIDPVATWPELRVISCWADANAAGPAARLAKRFPHARIQPKGLLSTEGFVTIPFGDAHALAYRSHVFEFRDGDSVKLATELETGSRYEVILTTGGGLFRYATEDLVELTGYRETCPLLRFVGRKHHVSDHFGEKLNEIFVRERLEHALRNVPHRFAMVACDGESYVLYLESEGSDAILLRATRSLEASLREAIHYDHCRRLGQLAALRLFRVEREGAASYLTSCAQTQTLGDIKIPALDRDQGWTRRFTGRFVDQNR